MKGFDPLNPTRRATLHLLGSASAVGLSGTALANTGETRQDTARALPTLPEVRADVARKVITLEPGGEDAEAVAVVSGLILGSGPRASVEARLGGLPCAVDETVADKLIAPGLIDLQVQPVLSALTLTPEIIAIEAWGCLREPPRPHARPRITWFISLPPRPH
jgi:hypothetical protein